jgi:hypothetical protein
LRLGLRWRRAFSLKGELEMADDPIDNFGIFNKGDDFHLCAALRAEERIHFIDFSYHLRPAFGGDRWRLIFNDWHMVKRRDSLAYLAPEGIGVEAVF